MLAGLLICLVTMTNDSGKREPHVLAGLLVLAGVGLRIEAAILAARAAPEPWSTTRPTPAQDR